MQKYQDSYYTDQLTGMQNRFALMDYLTSTSHINIFLINLDNFGSINKAYGFIVADEIFIEITHLLKVIKPQNAELFRFDGDEFVFAIKDFMSIKDINNFCKTVISFLTQSEIDIEKHDITMKISASVGVAMGVGLHVLKHARVAIDEVREYNKGSYKIYSSRSKFALLQEENIYWVNKIRTSLENEALSAYFQPIVDNKTGKIHKYECLARLQDLDVVVSPFRFMQASKITGTLTLVTKMIIHQSFEKFSGTEYEFSVNITGTDFYAAYLEEYLLDNCKKYKVEPSRVVLEILEDITTLDESNILNQITSMRKKGFKVSIDDFGAENSNFSRLLEFHPDYLKIDGAFVKNIIEDKQSQIIVEAIVDVCHKSNIKVIAEYVHSKDVLDKIVSMGIDYSQGFYLGQPKADLIKD